MKITLCSSTKFFYKLPEIKSELEKRGFEVFLPVMEDFSKDGEHANEKIHHDLIRKHFRKIDKSEAIYVANYDKNGIEGHIGGNCFLEMGKAFDKGIPIFLMKDHPKEVGYKDELIALQPVIVGQDWDKIKELVS